MWSHDFFERTLLNNGFRSIAGVDEVGRGALAGPVVAAAVVFDGRGEYEEIRDSKSVPAARRERLAGRILAEAAGVGFGSVSEEEIDRINILQATQQAMRLAIAELPASPDIVLVDGFWLPGLSMPCIGIIGGDRRSYSIAAASIVAKVHRDAFMRTLAAAHPQYGFERHKGYGTRLHMEAIGEHGPCARHRRSFTGIDDPAGTGGVHGQ